MEQLGYTQKDPAIIVGLKSCASEILNKKRKLTFEMIRQLHDKMNIPTEVLIRSYCCLLYTSPSPRDRTRSRMPSSA